MPLIPQAMPGGPPPPMMGGGAPNPQAALLARLMTGSDRPGGPPAGGPTPNGHGLTPLQGVQSVITDLHDLMRLLPDPAHVQVLATCLRAVTGIQKELMTKQGPGPGGVS